MSTAGPTDDDALVDALAQACYATMGVLTRIGADNELSLTQLRVLGILRDRRLRMSDLAAYLGLEKSTMSGLVDRAERRGLLQRMPSADDRRAIDVELTPAGRRLAAVLAADVARSLAPMTDVLAAGEQDRLRELLTRMLRPEISEMS